MDGANELDAPLPNVLVDHVADRGELGRGIAYWLGNALLDDESRSPQQIAEAVDAGQARPVRAAARAGRRDQGADHAGVREAPGAR